MSQEIVEAIREIEREKGIDAEALLAALEDALLAAYKKTPGASRHATVELDDAGDYRVYAIELPPELERPLRTREHFRSAEGRRVRVKTAAGTKARGEVVTAGERSFQLVNGTGEPVDIPYEAIVRANLIDEG